MLGVFQLTARSHHRVDVPGTLLQPYHLRLEGVHAIFVLFPLLLQRGQLFAALLEAVHLFAPVAIDGRVLGLDAFAIRRIGLAQYVLGALVQLVERGLALRLVRVNKNG